MKGANEILVGSPESPEQKQNADSVTIHPLSTNYDVKTITVPVNCIYTDENDSATHKVHTYLLKILPQYLTVPTRYCVIPNFIRTKWDPSISEQALRDAHVIVFLVDNPVSMTVPSAKFKKFKGECKPPFEFIITKTGHKFDPNGSDLDSVSRLWNIDRDAMTYVTISNSKDGDILPDQSRGLENYVKRVAARVQVSLDKALINILLKEQGELHDKVTQLQRQIPEQLGASQEQARKLQEQSSLLTAQDQAIQAHQMGMKSLEEQISDLRQTVAVKDTEIDQLNLKIDDLYMVIARKTQGFERQRTRDARSKMTREASSNLLSKVNFELMLYMKTITDSSFSMFRKHGITGKNRAIQLLAAMQGKDRSEQHELIMEVLRSDKGGIGEGSMKVILLHTLMCHQASSQEAIPSRTQISNGYRAHLTNYEHTLQQHLEFQPATVNLSSEIG